MRRDVGDREVREIDLARAPGGSAGRLGIAGRSERVTKESELEAEALAACAVEVAGEIPPLVPELRMWTVILRKPEAVRADGPGKVRCRIARHRRRALGRYGAAAHPPGERRERPGRQRAAH